MIVRATSLLFLITLAAAAQFPPPGPGRGGDGIWMRNAVLAERPTFDACNAHQPPTGEYHYHDNPVCLRLQVNDNIAKEGNRYVEQPAPWHHSPVLGWAYDGNPIYGPYGYADPRDASSPVRRMRSSFAPRTMKERHTLGEWAADLHGVATRLDERQFGPDVDARHPLGWYVEDYDYTAGSGDLDLYNGRFAVTPEFPQGTYAYFVTIDEAGRPAFPYVLGRQYCGAVPARQRKVSPGYVEKFVPGNQADPLLTSWLTRYNGEYARVIDGRRPDAGSVTTWPGQPTPAHPDIGEVLYSNDWVYVSGSGLASHTMGPWYEPGGGPWYEPGGNVFDNWPRDQDFQDRFPRRPQAAPVKTANMLGPLGRWINGVALFNMLDGGSWSNERHEDMMQGPPGGAGRGPGRGYASRD